MRITIFNPYFESLGGGEKSLAVMAEYLSRKHEVTILVKRPVDVQYTNKYFNVDLTNVTFKTLPAESFLVRLVGSRFIRLPGRWKSIVYDRAGLRALKKIGGDLFINGLYQSSMPSTCPKSIYMCMFPQKLSPGNVYHGFVRKTYNQMTTWMEKHFIGTRREAINSYTTVVANSNYTAGWIKKYWGREATVIYPPCDNMGPPAKHKKNIIFNVGRFFADNGSSHHKRQDRLIKAFLRLDRPGWELHLAGSVAQDPASKTYMAKLQRLAKNHSNITIHKNMPFNDIVRLRREASIYWHATGLGYDVSVFPENQEHFGMVTVEAMSAGAIPVVYNAAGQLEVVTNGKDGFLWNTLDEMIAQTQKLIDRPRLRQNLSKAAIKRAEVFDRGAFLKRIDQLILEVTNEK